MIATPRNYPQRNAPKPAFAVQSLWRAALWGSTAVAAVFVALLATRGDVTPARFTDLSTTLRPPGTLSVSPGKVTTQILRRDPPSQPEMDSAAQRLAQTVHGLAEDRDRLKARLAVIEQSMQDITGSVAKQIEAAKASTSKSSSPPWPADESTSPTPAAIAGLMTPVLPPSGLPPPASMPSAAPPAETSAPPTEVPSPVPPDASVPASSPTALEAAAPQAAPVIEYGVEIGRALTVQALRTRWTGIRTAHPQLFEGLSPMVAIRDSAGGRIELRLLAGPLSKPEAAAQLCAALAPFKVSCRPALFEGQRLASR